MQKHSIIKLLLLLMTLIRITFTMSVRLSRLNASVTQPQPHNKSCIHFIYLCFNWMEERWIFLWVRMGKSLAPRTTIRRQLPINVKYVIKFRERKAPKPNNCFRRSFWAHNLMHSFLVSLHSWILIRFSGRGDEEISQLCCMMDFRHNLLLLMTFSRRLSHRTLLSKRHFHSIRICYCIVRDINGIFTLPNAIKKKKLRLVVD